MEEKTIIRHCQKCEKEIKPEQKCYLISTGRFISKDMLFRAYPDDSNQYFHEECLNIL